MGMFIKMCNIKKLVHGQFHAPTKESACIVYSVYFMGVHRSTDYATLCTQCKFNEYTDRYLII